MKAISIITVILTTLIVTPSKAELPVNQPKPPDHSLRLEGSPLGIAWGFLYGCYGVANENYMPKVRDLGAGATKVYLLWSQIEPTKGHYDWKAVDSFTSQLHSPEEGLISIFSSSMWATKKPAAMLPPSPASNPDDYYRFIFDLVKHTKGKVRYWQNDAEPNNPIYWSGTKEEFVAQLKVFYRAVKDADSTAKVVVGGYDGLFNPPGTPPIPGQQVGLAFFDYVLQSGGAAFDLFDLRLYANPYTIQGRVEVIRQKMAALGYEKPIICTEYGGPGFFEMPQNLRYVPLVMSWSQSLQKPTKDGYPVADSGGKKGIADLYNKMESLAPETQLFMLGCRPELQAKFERIQARDLVMRNLFAFAAGVQRTLYWDLVNDVSDRDDLMTLMYGKIAILGYEKGKLTKRFPVADAYARMAQQLAGVRRVTQIPVPEKPTVFLFEVERRHRKPLYVVWEKRNTFSGEDLPTIPFGMKWPSRSVTAVDALGKTVATTIIDGQMSLALSITPIFLEVK